MTVSPSLRDSAPERPIRGALPFLILGFAIWPLYMAFPPAMGPPVPLIPYLFGVVCGASAISYSIGIRSGFRSVKPLLVGVLGVVLSLTTFVAIDLVIALATGPVS